MRASQHGPDPLSPVGTGRHAARRRGSQAKPFRHAGSLFQDRRTGSGCAECPHRSSAGAAQKGALRPEIVVATTESAESVSGPSLLVFSGRTGLKTKKIGQK